MRLREFGNTALRVSEYGLGCARVGGIFQSGSAGFLDLLSFAYESGITFFDTADMYSQGESESLIGKALRGKRDKIVIASKAGYKLPTQRRLAGKLKPFLRPVIQLLKIRRDRLPSGARGALAQDFSPKYLQSAVEGSLKRLRTDYLDILQLHSPPPEVVAHGDWQRGLEELRRAGKVRYYGIAAESFDAALAALQVPGVSSIQFTLSLLETRAATELFPQAAAKGIGGIARECLGNGLLAKPAHELDLKANCSSVEQEEQRRRQLEELGQSARDAGRTVLQNAVAYPVGVEGVSVTLLGARTVAQLSGLLEAARL